MFDGKLLGRGLVGRVVGLHKVGAVDGLFDGDAEGCVNDGIKDGACDGYPVGLKVGHVDGNSMVGLKDG